jgi:hypothetical protein
MLTKIEVRLGRADAETHFLFGKRRGYVGLISKNVQPDTMLDLLYILQTIEDRINTLTEIRIRLTQGGKPSNTVAVIGEVAQ